MLKSRVLLPSDGSDTSLKAAAYASRLMKTNPDLKLSVLVVVPESSGFMEIDRAMEEKGKEIMDRTLQGFIKEGLEVERYIEKGDPATVIINYAERGGYDHIIMGSRGASELRGAAIGSVSHKVIHLANCRVTLVK
ncbi:universal stress protein [Pelotomaculum propionicicum]|uniref:universal stress protein n=1 Tax=Pelotomaculum propionicicum TaxID=258475 RepID=UPI003B77188C